MRIDSHHHLWTFTQTEYPWISPQMGPLRQDFGPAELSGVLHTSGLAGAVVVQARQSLAETEWLLELAAANDFMLGVVGWLPLAETRIASILDEYADNAWLTAVRHVVQDEPDDDFLLGQAFNEGVKQLREFGLAYDLLIYARQLPATLQFVDQHPEQVFVLDHIAKPTIAGEQIDPEWDRDFQELAKRPLVSCKFSGVVTEVRDAAWTVDTLRPYWDAAWNAFGPKRMMFGSDWPVCLLRTQYADWVTAVEQLAAELSESEQAAFWGDNAINAYQLNCD